MQLLLLLAAPQYNLFVVGDHDQSIYAFRGSDIGIILSFQQMFPQGVVIKLEQNYRSVGNVVTAGNAIIQNNPSPFDKVLRSNKEQGKPVQVVHCQNEYQEAAYLAATIKAKVLTENIHYKDCAILYRSNAQSRILEEMFRNQFIPYTIVGGHDFYQREEIKDTLAYLRAIYNRKDDGAILRVLNKPSRGIGKTSQDKIESYAHEQKVSVYRALKNVDDIPGMTKRSSSKVTAFFDLLDHLQEKAKSGMRLSAFIRYVVEQSGLWNHYTQEKMNDEKRDNLHEFFLLTERYEIEHPDKTLEDFLQELSLVTDTADPKETDCVKFMTMHGSKGLEFPYVFLLGWNEGVFPSWRSHSDKEIQEERRLAYVGITRAEKELVITYADQRSQLDGKQKTQKVSRFIEELPEELVETTTLQMK